MLRTVNVSLGRIACFVLMPVFIFLNMAAAHAQETKITVSGVVKADSSALSNVTVSVKANPKIATLTKEDGSFTLSVPAGSVLVFSSIGFQKLEQPVTGSTMHVTLATDSKALDEVVVVGYGAQKKKDLTGSIASVKGSDLTHLPSQRTDQALQGRAAGVRVQTTDGAAPGANTIIRVRGSNSLQGGNGALIVIDGIQGGNLGDLNPNDIETMEILKDASATAIYGAQGANGVVLVTTKKGKTGKPVINYSYDRSLNKLSKKIALLSAGEFADNINAYQMAQNGSGITPVPVFTQAEVDGFYKNGGTDWQDVIYRAATSQNHQLSISGLSGKSDYFVSGGYLDQPGILEGSAYKRLSLRANLNTAISNNVKFGIAWSMAKTDGTGSSYGGSADWGNNAIGTALAFAPTVPVYDSTGAYSTYPPYGQPGYWNPLANALEPYISNNSMTNNLLGYLEIKPFNGLTLRITGSGIFTNVNNMNYYNILTQDGYGSSGVGTSAANTTRNYQNSNILTYDKTFGKHHLVVTGVAEQQVQKYVGSSITGRKFTVQQTGIYDLSGAATLTASSAKTDRALNSFLGRINYGFMDKYLITASIRRDGSSVFGANNKWGNFPAAAFSWNVISEDFMKSMPTFSNLKLRTSWGITGNQGIDPYGSLAKVTGGQNYPYNGTDATDLGYSITTAPNPNLKWEKTTQKNIGVDVGLFKNRVNITADYYHKVTKDLLMSRQLPTYTGISTILDNVGSMQNKGFELAIQATPVSGPVVWNTGFNISFNKNKVLDLGASDSISVANSNGHGGATEGLPLSMLIKGQPLGQMYGFITQGTWSQADAAKAAAYGQLPGDIKYFDANNDGTIDVNDRRPMGNAYPKYTFGWSNDFSYKGFTLSFQMVGSVGNDVFNLARYAIEGYDNGTGANLKNRWTPENQNTDVPALIDVATRDAAGLATKISLPSSTSGLVSRWVEKASFLRMQYASITYNFPKQIVERLRMSNISLHGSVSNVFTITGYQGYNPEVASWTGSDAQIGSDYNSYPAARIFNIGIHVTY